MRWPAVYRTGSGAEARQNIIERENRFLKFPIDRQDAKTYQLENNTGGAAIIAL